jgi:hypothetical protein
VALLLGAVTANGQVSAASVARISATLHGSVTLSVHTVPVAFLLDQQFPQSNFVAVPFTTKWNLNSNQVRGIEVVAYFGGQGTALASEHGVAIAPQHVLGRLNQGAFRPFIETHFAGTPAASLGLLQMPIDRSNYRGLRSDVLEMRVQREELPGLDDATYTGVLHLEARYF